MAPGMAANGWGPEVPFVAPDVSISFATARRGLEFTRQGKGLDGDQTQPRGLVERLDSVVHLQLVVDIGKMEVNRALGHI